MKYRRLKLEYKDKVIPDGWENKTITTVKLVAEAYGENFDSLVEAEQHIKDNKRDFVGNALMILPVYYVDSVGKIY